MVNKAIPKCSDCANLVRRGTGHKVSGYCESINVTDFLRGNVYLSTKVARTSGSCKPEGKYFEPCKDILT